MRKIFTIGETVYDIIFKNGKKISAKPGGAMLNTAVSLGRLGLPVSFISEIGKDTEGKHIIDFLRTNNVQTDYIYQFNIGNTAIAHAMLDEQENANYTFYKNYPQERMPQKMPEVSDMDIVLFGSFFAITREVRDPLINFIKQAKQQNSILLYDPNFRKPHLNELHKIKEFILENIAHSTIVRGSDEDFQLIFNASNADEAFKIITEYGGEYLIYTSSKKSVEFRSSALSILLPVPKIEVMSTIGAGDNFNAGVIFSLTRKGLIKKDLVGLSKDSWLEILVNATKFGTHVCSHFDNYISHDFAKQIKN